MVDRRGEGHEELCLSNNRRSLFSYKLKSENTDLFVPTWTRVTFHLNVHSDTLSLGAALSLVKSSGGL